MHSSSIKCIGLALLVAATPASTASRVQVPDNVAMALLFKADQAVRGGVASRRLLDKAAIETLIADDTERRTKVRALLDAGALRTGTDYYGAAFVFQHGRRPDDYLLAHSLALAAVARGRSDASWIAAATLDRYLQAIGQKQIYGTQFMVTRTSAVPGLPTPATMPAPTATMEPYDPALVPDSLRTALGVPIRAEQDKRLAGMLAAE